MGNVLTRDNSRCVPVQFFNSCIKESLWRKGNCLPHSWNVDFDNMGVPHCLPLEEMVEACSMISHISRSPAISEHLDVIFQQGIKDLAKEEQSSLTTLLDQHASFFATGLLDLHHTSPVIHSIKIWDAKPKRSQP